MDFDDAAGLLDGLRGSRARAARAELLSGCADEGFAEQELRAAVAEDRLALLPVERLLGGRYTAGRSSSASGLPAAVLIRFRRLLGLPEPGLDERVFSDEDIEAARSTSCSSTRASTRRRSSRSRACSARAMARLAATIDGGFVDTSCSRATPSRRSPCASPRWPSS